MRDIKELHDFIHELFGDNVLNIQTLELMNPSYKWHDKLNKVEVNITFASNDENLLFYGLVPTLNCRIVLDINRTFDYYYLKAKELKREIIDKAMVLGNFEGLSYEEQLIMLFNALDGAIFNKTFIELLYMEYFRGNKNGKN